MDARASKSELLALSRAIVVRLNSASGETTVRFRSPSSSSILSTNTDGWCIQLGRGPGKMQFEVWLDRWAGLSGRFYWFGFYTTSSSRVRHCLKLVSPMGYKRKPLIFGDRDWNKDESYAHLRHPLTKSDFDRLICEDYRGLQEGFFGIYSPLATPLGKSGMRAVAQEAVNFLKAFSRAMRIEALDTNHGTNGKKKHVFPRSSKEVEQGAVKFVRKWLKNHEYNVTSRESEACGYDLLAERTGDKDLHIEVKGAAGSLPRFFLTLNEHNAAKEDPAWRLALVTQVLRAPKLKVYRHGEIRLNFDMWPMTWQLLPKEKQGQPR